MCRYRFVFRTLRHWLPIPPSLKMYVRASLPQDSVVLFLDGTHRARAPGGPGSGTETAGSEANVKDCASRQDSHGPSSRPSRLDEGSEGEVTREECHRTQNVVVARQRRARREEKDHGHEDQRAHDEPANAPARI